MRMNLIRTILPAPAADRVLNFQPDDFDKFYVNFIKISFRSHFFYILEHPKYVPIFELENVICKIYLPFVCIIDSSGKINFRSYKLTDLSETL